MIKKLLLLDDDRDFCNLAQSIATSYDCRLDFYHSFAELGGMAKVKDYDAAIFDHYMNGTTGYELVEYANFFFETTPLFLISSKDDLMHSERDRIRNSSYFQFFSKKIGMDAILIGILENLERRDFLSRVSREVRSKEKTLPSVAVQQRRY